jgi:dipeptidase E
MNTNIFAIGGGEIGRPGTEIETLRIDAEIVATSNKKNPRLLFIPTASNDSPGYMSIVESYFTTHHGCVVTHLPLVNTEMSPEEIEHRILGADIIYVGGGNTDTMMQIWKEKGIDTLLKKAYTQGVILSGLSAGAICWFTAGTSDSKIMEDPTSTEYIRVEGLNLIQGLCSPHHVREPARITSVHTLLNTNEHAFGIDDCAALHVHNGEIRVITSNSDAGVTLFSKQGGMVTERILPKNLWIQSRDLGTVSEPKDSMYREKIA